MSAPNTNTVCVNKYRTSSDTFISITGSGSSNIIESSNSWLEYRDVLNLYQFNGFLNEEAGLALKLNNPSEKDYYINYGMDTSLGLDNIQLFNKNKQYLKLKQFKPQNIGYPVLYKQDEAWASYDVTTGMNSKKVFSYAVNVIEKLFIDGLIFTGTGVEFDSTSGILQSISAEKLPEIFTGTDYYLSNYQTICAATADCASLQSENPQPKILCWTGKDTESSDFKNWLETNFSGLANDEDIRKDAETSLTTLVTKSVTQNFIIKTGYILYNSWVSGDSITWNLYGYDYLNVYKDYHLNNLPLYPNTGFTIKYLNDWNSIESLTNKLNEKLKNINYPVWYPYECLRKTPVGIYISGGLMEFSRESTGSPDYNNRINYVSLHSLPVIQTGETLLSDNVYNLDINLIEDRKIIKINSYSGYSYLLPDIIQLEGYDTLTEEWKILDRREGLVNIFQATGSDGAPLFKRRYRSLYPRLDNPAIPRSALPSSTTEEEEDPLTNYLKDLSTGCNLQTLLQFSRVLVKDMGKLCPPNVTTQDVSFVYPANCPSFIISGGKKINVVPGYWCPDASKDVDGGNGEEIPPESDGSGGSGSGITPIIKGEYTILRAGWNLSGENGLNAINAEYDQYRVKLINFSGSNLTGFLPKNNFIVDNINLFGLKDSPIESHSAGKQCLIGADYYIDVFGNVPIKMTGIYNYTITPKMNGYFEFNQTPFIRKIEDVERPIKFNKVSGKITSEYATGYLSLKITGSGQMSYTNDDYYFYDTLLREISFEKTIVGNLYGSGYLSGKATALKQSVINKELLVGGKFATVVAYETITKNGYFSGQLDNVQYKAYDLVGLYKITGTVSGLSQSGFANINKLVSGASDYIENKPYHPIPTGYKNATGFIFLDTEKLTDLDIISINNQEITYHNDNISYLPPIFFDTAEVLIDTINNDPSLFSITASGDGNTIYLSSLVSGSAGNNIKLTKSSANSAAIILNGNSLSGGLDHYSFLDKPTFVNIFDNYYFSGIVNKTLVATGFYTGSNYGYISGPINSFRGFRNFANIWKIKTGIRSNNLISLNEVNNSYKSSGYFGSNQIHNLIFNLSYLNNKELSDQNNIDVIDIKVENLNDLENSGVYFRISGAI
jgi:hypothetical protein